MTDKKKTIFWPVEGSFEPDPFLGEDAINEHFEPPNWMPTQTPVIDRRDFNQTADAYLDQMKLTVFVGLYKGTGSPFVVSTGMSYNEAFTGLEAYRKENDPAPSNYKIVTLKANPDADLDF